MKPEQSNDLQHPLASRPSGPLANCREFSRLISAAVINQNFCNLLLTSPAAALTTGYGGETFQLTAEQQNLILSIRATSLSNFAMQLVASRNGNGRNGHTGDGNRHTNYTETATRSNTRDTRSPNGR
jgi:hypothetical protein